jgi:hypothetical protein
MPPRIENVPPVFGFPKLMYRQRHLRGISVVRLSCVWVVLHLCALAPSVAGRDLQIPQSRKDDSATQKTAPSEKVTFTLFAITDGFDLNEFMPNPDPKDKDHPYVQILFHGASYRVSDGRRVTSDITNLGSPSFTAQYLAGKLKGAKILDREPRTNEKGEVIGERIVGMFPVFALPDEPGSKGSQESMPMIIRTTGTVYQVFAGDHDVPLDDVLALEEYLYKPDTSTASAKSTNSAGFISRDSILGNFSAVLRDLRSESSHFTAYGPGEKAPVLDYHGRAIQVRDAENKEVTILGTESRWRAIDNEVVSHYVVDLLEPILAREYLADTLRSATILERKPIQDGKQKITGEWVVAMIPTPLNADGVGGAGRPSPMAAVIVTDGTSLSRIISANLQDALAFENSVRIQK